MVEKYDQLRAQNKISSEEGSCLQDEKTAVHTYQGRLRDKLTEAMEKGTGLFRGVSRDASSLGKSLSEILKKMFGQVVPTSIPSWKWAPDRSRATRPKWSSRRQT